jgi:acetyl-CoA acetyltransferase
VPTARRAPAFAWLVLLAVGWPGGVDGATTQAYCATALSTVELAAISPGAEEISALVRADGHSECAWSVKGQGEANTLSLTFWEPRSMAEALVPAESPEAFFEIYVESAESVRGKKREALTGVGQRSALFRDGNVRELYLLTKTGVAHLVTDALTDAQLEAVARAVAAP